MKKTEFVNLQKLASHVGDEMHQLMNELYPICRSITGDGVRKTLKIISKYVPLDIHEVKTGSKVFDWTIPKEWNINDAYVADSTGNKIIDFQKSNLHVVNYSIPINKKVSLEELKKHIHTIPEKPELIPYMTSYYNENWGFCMSHNEFKKLSEDEYHVIIDSTLKEGSLTYGEYYLKGETDEEILFSTYVCHPSLCNDNLSGIVLTTMLAKYLTNLSKKYSIRFLFIPETIGAITWLCVNEKLVSNIKHGLVVTCVGDSGTFTYKKSRQGNTEIDRTVIEVLRKTNKDFRIKDFFPWGSDERQFCSPGFNLPVGSLYRSQYGTSEFPEYHTSADNLDFVKKESLIEAFSTYLSIILNLEQDNTKKIALNKELSERPELIKNNDLPEGHDLVYYNLYPKCEPNLGKRGLYSMLGGQNKPEINRFKFTLLWLLNFSDGKHSLLDISTRSGIEFNAIKNAAKILEEHGILNFQQNFFE